jgi:hypothetical protein
MSNPIKYSTGTESLALKKGNFYIGTGDVGKGPTSSTGYYNGISPPSGGYTIYLNKETGGPSIYTASNDSELIGLTNSIAGTSYTTANECLVYFAGQTDKMVLNRDYEGIITNGLVLNLDAGFTPSYPKNGTTWYDLSGKNNHAYMASKNSQNPVFNTDKFYFDGNNSQSYFYNGSAPTLSGDGVTVFLISEPSSYDDTTNGRLYAMDTRYSISKGYNGNANPGIGVGFDRVNSTNLKTFNFVTNASNGGSYTEANIPNNYQYSTKYISMSRREAGSSDITVLGTDSETIVNPTYVNKGLSSNTIPSDGYVIGCFNGNPWITFSNFWFSGNIYQVIMYNRYLSDSEVTYMASILKTKYNI